MRDRATVILAASRRGTSGLAAKPAKSLDLHAAREDDDGGCA